MFNTNYIISGNRLKIFLKINSSKLKIINNLNFITYEIVPAQFYNSEDETECKELKTKIFHAEIYYLPIRFTDRESEIIFELIKTIERIQNPYETNNQILPQVKMIAELIRKEIELNYIY